MQWTQEQEKVIQSRNRNLLVSAAAGSGKTAVLVERIVRMVTEGPDPVDLDRLLVTSAAVGTGGGEEGGIWTGPAPCRGTEEPRACVALQNSECTL